jgi:hypothetical protein
MPGETDELESFAAIIGQAETDVHDAGTPANSPKGVEVAVAPKAALPFVDPLPDFEVTAA